MKRNIKSLEDTIRDLEKKNRGKPSPLSNLRENFNNSPIEHIQQNNQKPDLKNNLIGDFKPANYRF